MIIAESSGLRARPGASCRTTQTPCAGDTHEAARIARQLADLDTPYLLGQNTIWRARIAALLGDRDQAVALLRDAYAEGYSWWLELHYDIDFESLRDHAAFQELIRPKG